MSDFNIEFSNEESDDVMMRLMNQKTGQEITFITADENLFDGGDLGPIVTSLGDQVVLAYNGRLVEEMIQRSVERNADEFGEAAAAFLVLSKIVKDGMRIALDRFEDN